MLKSLKGYLEASIEAQSKNLLVVCLHGFGILELHLGRGDIWEQFSYLHPECKRKIKCHCVKERIQRTLSISHQFLDRM